MAAFAVLALGGLTTPVLPSPPRTRVQLMRSHRVPAGTARELRDAEVEAERVARELKWT